MENKFPLGSKVMIRKPDGVLFFDVDSWNPFDNTYHLKGTKEDTRYKESELEQADFLWKNIEHGTKVKGEEDLTA